MMSYCPATVKVNVRYTHVRWEQGHPVQYVNSQHVCNIMVAKAAKQAFRTCFRKVLTFSPHHCAKKSTLHRKGRV